MKTEIPSIIVAALETIAVVIVAGTISILVSHVLTQSGKNSTRHVEIKFVKDMTAINLLSDIMGQDCEHIIVHEQEVTLSAYTACKGECDATPEVTADGTPSRIGLVAVSRDFINSGKLHLGQRIIIPKYGVFEVADLMNKRYKNCVDILHATKKSARMFGRKKGEKVLWLETVENNT